MSSALRVSIPNNARKTIQNIKEIARNHSDDDIYAMLKECSMDPNETAQKLLLQDTFHEVRRKRERKKENLNREFADSRWRPGTQGRGGRGNYSPRYISYDGGRGRNAAAGKENGNQGTEKGLTIPSSLPASDAIENKATIPVSSSVTVMANGPLSIAYGSSSHGPASQLLVGCGVNRPEESSAVDVNKLGSAPSPPFDAKNTHTSGIEVTHVQSTPSSDHLLASITSASVSGVYSSASDPVLVPCLDLRLPGAVGAIKHEAGNQQIVVEPNATVPAESKSGSGQDFANHLQINKLVSHDITNPELSLSVNEKAALEIGNSFMRGKMPSKSQGVEKIQLSESSHSLSSSTHGGSASRPPSNYSSRPQQLTGPQKVGPGKEWKPKPTNSNPAQAFGTVGTSEVPPVSVKTGALSLPGLRASASEETTSKMQKKLEELHFSDDRHVIIPNHLQVPEAERTGLNFGSFDASFEVRSSYANGPDSDKSSTSLYESSQGIEETTEEPSSSNEIASSTAQEQDYSDHPQSPMHMPENLLSREANVLFSAVTEYDQSMQETALPPGSPQCSFVHSAPNYSFGFMQPVPGSQLAPFEISEPQPRDASHLPSFVVQQPFNLSTSYYTQFYRLGADGDGRFPPFLAPGAITKHNGNIAVLPPLAGQSQENGNSLVLTTAGPTPLMTQAAGVMQNSVAVTQQPIPVYQQPAGLPISHYPPNYIPYSHYFSPFYIPPPTIHQFLSNGALPPQPLPGNAYPPPAAAAATGVKYSLSQYKPGTNTGNSTHIGMLTGYGPYSSSPAGYGPNPSANTGNSTANEDLAASQFKENVYINGQQSEGSAVWIPAPGRDISGLQASSFYNLPPQGQHVSFAPSQSGHSAFSGIYHPAQTVAAATVHPLLQQSQIMAGAVEMVGTPGGIYQQPQHAQNNWTNNY